MKGKILKSLLAMALSMGIIATSLATSYAAEPVNENQAKAIRTIRKPTITKSSPLYKELTNGMFDYEWYKANNPDVVAVFGDNKEMLLRHFLIYGLYEGRQPNEDFNINAYASAYADLQKAFDGKGNEYQVIVNYYNHYVNYGKEEKREIVSIEKAMEAGITVTKIGSDVVIKDASEAVKPIYNEPVTTIVEVPAYSRTYNSIYDPSIVTTANNALEYIMNTVKQMVEDYPELLNITKVSNYYNTYLTTPLVNLADVSLATFYQEELRTFLTDAAIDSVISDSARAAKAKTDLTIIKKVFEELANIPDTDYTEVVAYNNATFGIGGSLLSYTYDGLYYNDTYKYYVDQATATAAYNTDLASDPTVNSANYRVAVYADFATAKAAFLSSIPSNLQNGFFAYINSVGVSPEVVYFKQVEGYDGANFAAYFDNMMSTTY